MKAQEIQEVFDLQDVLTQADASVIASPNLLAALIDWKHSDSGQVGYVEPVKTSRGKAKTEPSPDPDEPGF